MEGRRVSQAAVSGLAPTRVPHRSWVRVTSDPEPRWPAMFGPSEADIQPPDQPPAHTSFPAVSTPRHWTKSNLTPRASCQG